MVMIEFGKAIECKTNLIKYMGSIFESDDLS